MEKFCPGREYPIGPYHVMVPGFIAGLVKIFSILILFFSSMEYSVKLQVNAYILFLNVYYELIDLNFPLLIYLK